MEPIELLSKQLEQYQDSNQKTLQQYINQNESDHKQLNDKIDELLKEIHSLNTDKGISDAKLTALEQGQSEIKTDIKKIQEDLKVLEDHHLKRQHAWHLFIKIISTTAIIGSIAGVILKLSGIF